MIIILKCDHSDESYSAVLSCATLPYAVHDILRCDCSNESYTVLSKILCSKICSTTRKYCSVAFRAVIKISDRRCSDLNTRNKLVALSVNLTYINRQDHP